MMAKSDKLRAARRVVRDIKRQDPPEKVDTEKFTPLTQIDMGPTEEHDRMTTILQIHHEHIGDAPSSCDLRGSFITETQEQPFFRRLKVTEEWQDLPSGGIQDIGLIVIENLAGKNRRTNPSEEERQEIEEQILIIGFDHNENLQVAPGRFTVFDPRADYGSISLKAASGSFEVKLYIFPR